MTTSLRFVTATAEDTRRLGEALARVVRRGDVVSLSGDLGAGKTCFVQGMARGLDVQVPVTSPTFMLQRTYPGREVLVHLDVYRLDRLQDVVELGDDALAPDTITVIEWGDTVAALLPDDRIEIQLRHRDDPGADDHDASPAGGRAATGPGAGQASAVDDPAADGGLVDLPRTVVATLHGRWAERRDELASAAAAHLDHDHS